MNTEQIHILSKDDVVKLVQAAWDISSLEFSGKDVVTLKLVDFELMASTMELFFKKSIQYNIEIVSAGAIYNLVKFGESKRNRSVAVVALYVLLNQDVLNETEKEHFNTLINGRDLFSKYTNRVKILSIVKEKRQKQDVKFQKRNFKSSNSIMIIVLGLVILFTTVGAIYLKGNREQIFKKNLYWNIEICENYYYSPCLTKITYDLSKIKYRNAYLDFGSAGKIKIQNKKGEINQILNIKQTPTIKLIIDNLSYEKDLGVKSAHWIAKINETFIPKSFYYTGGQLHIESENLYTYVKPQDEYYITYSKGRNFNYSIEGIVFEAKVKNNIKEGGINCFDVSFDLSSKLDNKKIQAGFNLLIPGCTQYAKIKLGDLILESNNIDTSPSGIDLSDWRIIRWSFMNKKLKIWVDDQKIYDIPFEKDLGLLTYIQVLFKGNGSFEYYKITSDNGQVLMEDDFNEKF